MEGGSIRSIAARVRLARALWMSRRGQEAAALEALEEALAEANPGDLLDVNDVLEICARPCWKGQTDILPLARSVWRNASFAPGSRVDEELYWKALIEGDPAPLASAAERLVMLAPGEPVTSLALAWASGGSSAGATRRRVRGIGRHHRLGSWYHDELERALGTAPAPVTEVTGSIR